MYDIYLCVVYVLCEYVWSGWVYKLVLYVCV